jgi:hypothetical protein
MDDIVLDKADWLEGGFPEPKSATKNQRLFINRRAHLLAKVLSMEEKVALRMMRYEFWLNNLSRLDASAIINKMRIFEEREKEEAIARRLAKRRAKSQGDISGDACSVCGGKLDEDPIAPTCTACGKGSFRVTM